MPSWEQVGWNSVREHAHDLAKIVVKSVLVRSHLLQASLLVLVTSSRGQEIIVMAARPSVATVPISTDHPARVLGAKRYLGKNLILSSSDKRRKIAVILSPPGNHLARNDNTKPSCHRRAQRGKSRAGSLLAEVKLKILWDESAKTDKTNQGSHR